MKSSIAARSAVFARSILMSLFRSIPATVKTCQDFSNFVAFVSRSASKPLSPGPGTRPRHSVEGVPQAGGTKSTFTIPSGATSFGTSLSTIESVVESTTTSVRAVSGVASSCASATSAVVSPATSETTASGSPLEVEHPVVTAMIVQARIADRRRCLMKPPVVTEFYIGAGYGSRTRDVQLGKLSLYH